MKIGYCGKDTKAGIVRKTYVGVNGIARRCAKAYVGVNGKARLLYPTENIEIPTVSGSYTFDNQPHSAIIEGLDTDAVNVAGDITTADGGVHELVFSLASKYFTWEDGTKTNKTGSWEIESIEVEIPTVSGTHTYDGTVKEATITNLDPNFVRVIGTTATKKAGTYTVYFELINPNGCTWTDGTTDRKSGTWSITAIPVSVPSLQGTYYYIENTPQTVSITEYDSSIVGVSGTLVAADVGTYTVFFNIIDDGHMWADGTSEQKSATWSIQRAILTIPTLQNTYYTGYTQSAPMSNYNSERETATGNVSATNAGTYTVYFDIKDIRHYVWSDGTDVQKSVTWTINQMPIHIDVEPYTYKYKDEPIAEYHFYIRKDHNVEITTFVPQFTVRGIHNEIIPTAIMTKTETFYRGTNVNPVLNGVIGEYSSSFTQSAGVGTVTLSWDSYYLKIDYYDEFKISIDVSVVGTANYTSAQMQWQYDGDSHWGWG